MNNKGGNKGLLLRLLLNRTTKFHKVYPGEIFTWCQLISKYLRKNGEKWFDFDHITVGNKGLDEIVSLRKEDEEEMDAYFIGFTPNTHYMGIPEKGHMVICITKSEDVLCGT